MIYLILKDGLGNQLFQYAAARSLADKLNTGLSIDVSSFKFNPLRKYALASFRIQAQELTAFQLQILRVKRKLYKLAQAARLLHSNFYYHQHGFQFDPAFLNLPDNICIEGYWQSEKYFLSIEAIIRNEFVVKSDPDTENNILLDKIKSSMSVSLHVRRGDYVTDPDVNALHGICSLFYYQKAIEYIKSKVSNAHFFIFSDDMDWVHKNIVIEGSLVDYVTNNTEKDYEDLRLMYSCRHNIIANSSFSWWGAWLNQTPGKIIVAPKDWVKDRYHNPDLLPSSWIQISG